MDSLTLADSSQFLFAEGPGWMIVIAPGPAVFVIDRNPEMAMKGMISTRRDHCEIRHYPLRNAPVVIPVLRVAACADVQASRAFDNFKNRLQIPQVVLIAFCIFEQRVPVQVTAMQERHMAGIDASL